MKNVLMLFAMISFFITVSNTSTFAQNLISNGTNCEMHVLIQYGPACTPTGTVSLVVAANSQATFTLPAGNFIIAAKGRIGSVFGCLFYVGQPNCTPYTYIDNVSCTQACGSYTANLNPDVGIEFYY